jgi:hypothetical protein
MMLAVPTGCGLEALLVVRKRAGLGRGLIPGVAAGVRGSVACWQGYVVIRLGGQSR